LYVTDNCLYITDFKPTKEEIFRSIPQIAAYGKMFMNKLDPSYFDVKCISLNHEIAVEFYPSVLENEIMVFIYKINKLSISKALPTLKTKDNLLDLYDELKKFL